MKAVYFYDWLRSARARARPDGGLHDLAPHELLNQLYAAFALIGLVSGGTNVVSYARALSLWFDRQRGLALPALHLEPGRSLIARGGVAVAEGAEPGARGVGADRRRRGGASEAEQAQVGDQFLHVERLGCRRHRDDVAGADAGRSRGGVQRSGTGAALPHADDGQRCRPDRDAQRS